MLMTFPVMMFVPINECSCALVSLFFYLLAAILLKFSVNFSYTFWPVPNSFVHLHGKYFFSMCHQQFTNYSKFLGGKYHYGEKVTPCFKIKGTGLHRTVKSARLLTSRRKLDYIFRFLDYSNYILRIIA